MCLLWVSYIRISGDNRRLVSKNFFPEMPKAIKRKGNMVITTTISAKGPHLAGLSRPCLQNGKKYHKSVIKMNFSSKNSSWNIDFFRVLNYEIYNTCVCL